MKKPLITLFLIILSIKSAQKESPDQDKNPLFFGNYFVNLTERYDISLSTKQGRISSNFTARRFGLTLLPFTTESEGTFKRSVLFPLMARSYTVQKTTESLVVVEYHDMNFKNINLTKPWNTLILQTPETLSINGEKITGSDSYFSIFQKEDDILGYDFKGTETLLKKQKVTDIHIISFGEDNQTIFFHKSV